MLPWGGGLSTAYSKAKLKASVFENGHFSGHLNFYPEKQALLFFWKKIFFFFLKKMFFWDIFFEKISKTFWQMFCGQNSFGNFEKQFFEKKFQTKHFFSKRKENIFFLNQSSCLSGYKIFFSPKIVFCQKLIKCPLNCPFSKTDTFCFALK